MSGLPEIRLLLLLFPYTTSSFPFWVFLQFLKIFFLSRVFWTKSSSTYTNVSCFSKAWFQVFVLSLLHFPCSVSQYFFHSIPLLSLQIRFLVCIFLPSKTSPYPAFENPLTLNPLIFPWLPQSLKALIFFQAWSHFSFMIIYFFLEVPPSI